MKEELRKRVRSQRLEHRDAGKSMSIAQFLFSLPEYRKSKTILLYMPINNEVDTLGIIEDSLTHKTVCLPVTVGDHISVSEYSEHFVSGKYGVPEPRFKKYVDPANIDLAIVPGIAFDPKGGRVGYGKGYYDRLLKNVPGKKIALAYEFQLVPDIPSEPHDIAMDKIITEKGVIDID